MPGMREIKGSVLGRLPYYLVWQLPIALPSFLPSSLHSANKGSIRGGPIGPLRDIAMILALNDILIESIWFNSKSNDLANLLSRDKYEAIANKYPQLAHLVV